MIARPSFFAVTRPVMLTLATEGSLLDQVAVSYAMNVPSRSWALTVNCMESLSDVSTEVLGVTVTFDGLSGPVVLMQPGTNRTIRNGIAQ